MDLTGRVIAVWSQGGGMGKTTTAQTLAEIYACEWGQPVILGDADGQCSASVRWRRPAEDGASLFAVLEGRRSIMDVTHRIANNLLLVPASAGLYLWEYNETGIKALHQALASVRSRALVILDCGPSYTPLTKVSLVAATDLVIPCQPSLDDLTKLDGLRVTLESLGAQRVNDDLNILGVALTRCKSRTTLHREAAEYLRNESAWPVFDTTISESVAVQEAVGRGKTIVRYKSWHPVAHQYRALAKEIASVH